MLKSLFFVNIINLLHGAWWQSVPTEGITMGSNHNIYVAAYYKGLLQNQTHDLK